MRFLVRLPPGGSAAWFCVINASLLELQALAVEAKFYWFYSIYRFKMLNFLANEIHQNYISAGKSVVAN